MRVVFRADASRTTGTGHVMRCLTLADALRARGASVGFVTRLADGDLSAMIARAGFPVSRLAARDAALEPAAPETPDGGWSEDADETRTAIASVASRCDLLVVDSYRLDAKWEKQMRPVAGRIVVIDDLANRPHDCDVLLDQNLVAGMDARYASLVPGHCIQMLGPEYALLHPSYATLHEKMKPRSGQVRRIFVSFGSGDRMNLTGRFAAAFLALERSELSMDVVVAPSDPGRPALEALALREPRISVYAGLSTLASLMAEADVACGASGATTWERMCLGLPSVVVTMAANQVPIAEELHRRDLVRFIGASSEIADATIAEALEQLALQSLDGRWSERCLRLVDGLGTQRVVDRIWAT